MADLILSAQAEQDLIDIWCYIASDSSVNADNYIDKLYAKASMLAETPEIGLRREELSPNLKSFPVDRYVFYYRAIQSSVEIVRVLHSSRDVVLMLKK